MTQISDLGLSDDVIPVPLTHKGAKRRLIYTNDHGLLEVPSGPSWLFRRKPPFTKPLIFDLAREPFVKRRRVQDGEKDESIYSFCSRRLGQEVGFWSLRDYLEGLG